MAYSAVPTKTVGNTWTHTENNTYIKDNFAAGVPDIFTTKGDIAVASAADTAGRLGVGTNAHVLTADVSETLGIKWAALNNSGTAYACYTRTSNQTISTATYTIIDYATSVFDTDSAVTTGASWKFTVPASHGGYYLVSAAVYLAASAAWAAGETTILTLYKNGGEVHRLAQVVCQATGTFALTIGGSSVVQLNATDYIDVRIYQNSGSDTTITGTGTTNYIMIAKLF